MFAATAEAVNTGFRVRTAACSLAPRTTDTGRSAVLATLVSLWGLPSTRERRRPKSPASGSVSGSTSRAPAHGSPASSSTDGSTLAGSQVGSQTLWTAVDGCGRPWTRKPPVPTSVDGCGLLWTPLGDLRIRRLGVRVPPSVRSETSKEYADAPARLLRGFPVFASGIAPHCQDLLTPPSALVSAWSCGPVNLSWAQA
jgi:hypothetical protein